MLSGHHQQAKKQLQSSYVGDAAAERSPLAAAAVAEAAAESAVVDEAAAAAGALRAQEEPHTAPGVIALRADVAVVARRYSPASLQASDHAPASVCHRVPRRMKEVIRRQ